MGTRYTTSTLSRRSFVAGALGCAAVGALGLALPSLSARADAADDEAAVRVVALKGPTAMGMVEMMDASDNGEIEGASYEFSIVASTDEIAPLVAKAEADIICAPANLASVLYNNTEGGVRVLAINVLGVLYICTAGADVASVADLAGKTIYASGKGATPEYALNYILTANGLDPEADVTIEWKSEHSECVAALLQDPEAVAMLPQPFATTAMTKNPDIAAVLDLTEEWDATQAELPEEERSTLVTGVAMARTAFAEENPEAVQAFLDRYAESVEYVNANVEEAAELVGAYDIVTAEVAAKALPECSITYIDGDEMKSLLSGYLGVLYEQNPTSVGGALPADDFYWGATAGDETTADAGDEASEETSAEDAA